MKKLKLKEMIRAIAMPMLLLVGLVFTSATTVLDSFKPAAEAIIAVQQEIQIANELVGASLTARPLANGQSQAQVMVKLDFYNYLLSALNGGETEAALQVTSERMSQKYSTAETSSLFLVAKQEATILLSE